jgi:ribose transport system permease protein
MSTVAAGPRPETGQDAGARGRALEAARRVPHAAWPLVVFAILFVAGGIVRPNLLTLEALWGTAAFAMIMAIASAGQTLAVIQGGIDLSVPNTITLSALTFLSAVDRLGAFGAFVAAIAAGALVGVLNGTIIAKLELSPIVTTIAMNGFLFGVVLLTFDFSQLTDIPAFAHDITAAKIGFLGTEVAAVVPVGLALLLALQALLSWTGWGRSLFLVGAAPDVAALAGQPVDRIRITAYALSGALAAFAGIVIVGFYAQTSTGMGAPYLLGSVAAVVVGGASIFGGRGSMIGTLGGALVLGQVATLVAVANLGVNIQQLIYGVIILAVVALYGRRATER